MKLRRDVAALPCRSGAETWSKIVALISRANSLDIGQLDAAASTMAALLAEGIYAEAPITLKGDGHRLVIYCAYGADALTMGDDVVPLDWNPTAKPWTLFVPCEPDDADWASPILEKRAPRIRLHGVGEAVSGLDEDAAASKADYNIDWSAAS